MIRSSRRGPPGRWILALVAVAAFLGPGAAESSVILGFSAIDDKNKPADIATAGQYSVEVRGWADGLVGTPGQGIAANQVEFVFRNTAAAPSSITGVYWQDGTLLSIATVQESAGVSFSGPARPQNLPGGNLLKPNFLAHENFSAGADGNMATGVNADGEYVGVLFNLQQKPNSPAFYGYSDVIGALNVGYTDPSSAWNPDGTDKVGGAVGLRIGVHVTGFADGQSESFLNKQPLTTGIEAVPEPSMIALVTSGLILLGLARLLRLRRRPALAKGTELCRLGLDPVV